MANPVFRDANGNIITSIVCGQPYTFDVPGMSQVWLDQTKNGVVSFSGVFPVPMPSYSADCMRDVGGYTNSVYTVVNGAKGSFIGYAPFTVYPIPAAASPRPTSTGAPYIATSQGVAGNPNATNINTGTTYQGGISPISIVAPGEQSPATAAAIAPSLTPGSVGSTPQGGGTVYQGGPLYGFGPQPVDTGLAPQPGSLGIGTLALIGLGLYLLGRK